VAQGGSVLTHEGPAGPGGTAGPVGPAPQGPAPQGPAPQGPAPQGPGPASPAGLADPRPPGRGRAAPPGASRRSWTCGARIVTHKGICQPSPTTTSPRSRRPSAPASGGRPGSRGLGTRPADASILDLWCPVRRLKPKSPAARATTSPRSRNAPHEPRGTRPLKLRARRARARRSWTGGARFVAYRPKIPQPAPPQVHDRAGRPGERAPRAAGHPVSGPVCSRAPPGGAPPAARAAAAVPHPRRPAPAPPAARPADPPRAVRSARCPARSCSTWAC
jgi:hypothetical protein